LNKHHALISLSVALLSAGCAGTKTGDLGQGGTSGQGNHTGTAGTTGTGSGTGGQVGTGAGGNSAAGTFGTTGVGGGGGMRTCGLQQFAPTPKNADILLVLDRSESMTDPADSSMAASSTNPSKWSIVVPTLNAAITSTDSSVLWGMKSFPEGSGGECVTGSVTSAIDVGISAGNAAAVTAAISTVTPAGNGTPTGDAINAAVTYLKSLSDSNPKYILLATDGAPSCGAIPSKDNARPYAVTAVTNAKTAGFPTFVIGIATGDASDTATLNALADAGGEVPASANNPLAPHYYLASNMTALTAALGSITGQISSCVFPLATPPPVPNDATKLGVYLGAGMTKIPYDSKMANGWAYTDTNDSAVEVFGSWCTMIQAAGAGAVQIIFGCMSIDVP
jgi:hypothetical protein